MRFYGYKHDNRTPLVPILDLSTEQIRGQLWDLASGRLRYDFSPGLTREAVEEQLRIVLSLKRRGLA
jgi:hypothetical protein